ncbi:MAG: ATP-binding cassette domain-containing protein [Bacteroidales bacterium]|nr:ATP-binding cassette domain-containing protein [Bacteroidales bacterium]
MKKEEGLEVDSVIMRYGEHTVLSDVYLKCNVGDIIGIFGRNGSGKTTLFNIIYGTCTAENSFVRIDGKVISRGAFRGGLVGYLPQNDFFPAHLRIREVFSLLPQWRVDRKDEILGRVWETRAGELSGGELRYLEIMNLLWSGFKYLILDEPFSGLAPVMVERLCSILKEHSKTAGIMIADHDYRSVAGLVNRHFMLDSGELREISSFDELKGVYFL